ncbi:heat shock protein 90-associated, partial [Cymbomonas tetramitiformis]
SLFYIPSMNTEKFISSRENDGLTLYSRKVLIQHKVTDLLPSYLRFVRGVVDCEDVPLNISRESTQDSALLRRLREVLTTRLLRFLEQEANKDPEKYDEFFTEFGMRIKEGICESLLRVEGICESLLRVDLVEQQAAFMKTMAETIKVLSAEKKEPEKTSDHEEAESGVISPANAQKTVHKSTAEEKPSSRVGGRPSSRAEYGDNDAEDEDFADGDSFIIVPGSASVASTVLSAILKQVTAGDAFDVVRRCGNDGLKAFRKLKCRVEPQLFGQLAGSMKKLCKLTVNVNEDPVKQLGYFGDVMSSVANYGGARLDPITVEVLVTAMAVAAMPIEYSQVVADMSKERRPSFDMLVQRSEYFFVNVVQQSLVPSSSIVGATVDGKTVAVVRALVADRRRQSEEKKVNDGKKLICPTCSGVHSAEKCWIVNPEGMEEFIKLNPAKERAVRENYARRLKKIAAKKAPDAAAATVEEATSSSSARPRRTEVSAGELWSLENHEEVHVACPVVTTVVDQKVVYTGEVLEDTWVYGVFNRDKEDDAQVQNEYYEDSLQAPGGDLCAVTVVDSDRELYFDSMATKSIFNDLSMFDGAQVNASAAMSFKVMAGEVTTSRGGGQGSITLWNRVTKKADVLKVEAQYMSESPFNLVSAVSLEDKFGLNAQFGDRVLQDKENLCEYDVCRKGNVYVLPEVIVEAALPGVECDEKENCPVRDKFNWKFTEFKKWNEEKGPFHLDICADEHNRQVNEYYSLVNSVFLHCLTGRSFWGIPPYDDIFIERQLTKVLMDFPKDPVNMKFLLVLPYKPNAAWWRLTTKFEELHIYSKGSVIFSARIDQCYNVSELVESEPGRVFIQGTPWLVVVLYLDQFVVPRVDAKVIAHIRLGHTCDKHVEVMDLQGLDLGVNSEELRSSSVLSCSVNCMACQVAAPKRPSQTTDRGRVPKSVRKVVEKRQVSVKMGQLTFTDHGGPFVTSTKGYRGYTIHVDDYSDVCHFYVWKQKLEYVDALEDYRKMVKATGRVFLEEETRVEQVVYDLDVLVLHSDNDSTIVSGKAKQYL